METPKEEPQCWWPEKKCLICSRVCELRESTPSEGWAKTLEENRYGDKYVTANKGMRTLTLIDYVSEVIGQALSQQRAAEQEKLKAAIGLLRQWLNESRITDKKMVTNEELEVWLIGIGGLDEQ